MEYFWITGLLSSVLDNAPTYLFFLNSIRGQHFAERISIEPRAIKALFNSEKEIRFVAVWLGGVFLGVLTYI